MQIVNVRAAGFATNSSSSHSMILVTGKKPHEVLLDYPNFGWGNFVLTTTEHKRAYVAGLLKSSLRTMSPEAAHAIALKLTGARGDLDEDLYVDHQSVVTFPNDWDGRPIDMEFFKDYLKYVLDDRVVILGGNDNDDGDAWKPEGLPANTNVLRDNYTGFVGRKDSRGYWTLFNRYNGSKIRVFLQHDVPEPDMFAKADVPELVDIKITDYCAYDCPMCYQGSSREGKHGNLKSIAYTLGELKVFEAAIGGGEPTTHPKFWEFLADLRMYGVIPNFTTRNLSWLSNRQHVEHVNKYCGGVAFSIHSAAQMMAIHKKAEKAELLRYNFQYIVGHVKNEAEKILKASQWVRDEHENLSVTLLGWKDTKRGGSVRPKTDPWIPFLREAGTVSIDTVLADMYANELTNAGVPEWCYTRKDGKFSMYIDAVNGTIGPSSYCEDKEMIKCTEEVHYAAMPNLGKEIRREFPRW